MYEFLFETCIFQVLELCTNFYLKYEFFVNVF